MLKKLFTAILSLTIAFTPAAGFVFHEKEHTAYAKSYKSGKRGFTPNTNNNFQNRNKQQFNNNNRATTPRATNRGGFMRGMLYGGLAGMLLGGLFGNMGPLGAVMGLLINIVAILVLIMIIRAIFTRLFSRRRNQDNQWRR
ncbi:hypothetical protein [Peribacillus sp. SCS-155]|uniref:hypothetical protein n=1 Tax=Peribacillus sedimenti TaxID=3115297 RepID=UPI0039061A9D